MLRLWIEPHDGVVRARLMTLDSDETVVIAGTENIVDAVRQHIRAFQ